MWITKKNGNITVYDDEKLIRSILRANAETGERKLTQKQAAAIASQVFARLTEESEIITTADIRRGTDRILRERGLPETAQHYMDYAK